MNFITLFLTSNHQLFCLIWLILKTILSISKGACMVCQGHWNVEILLIISLCSGNNLPLSPNLNRVVWSSQKLVVTLILWQKGENSLTNSHYRHVHQQTLHTLCCISLGSFAFLALFWAHVGQPDDHIGWPTLIPFASIFSTNSRTNPWNFRKKILRIGGVEKLSCFESAILIFFASSQ